jgi:hypothetical protein
MNPDRVPFSPANAKGIECFHTSKPKNEEEEILSEFRPKASWFDLGSSNITIVPVFPSSAHPTAQRFSQLSWRLKLRSVPL